MTTIEQLKQNERPFGLMSKEMQIEAESIGEREFQEYMGMHLASHVWTKFSTCLAEKRTYRLRPDYKQEPEVIDTLSEGWVISSDVHVVQLQRKMDELIALVRSGK